MKPLALIQQALALTTLFTSIQISDVHSQAGAVLFQKLGMR